MSEAERCFVCFEEGDLKRVCACATLAHRACVEETVERVRAYDGGACPVCKEAYLMRQTMERVTLEWNFEGVAVMAFVLYESCVALLPFVILATILLCNGMAKEMIRTLQFGLIAYAVLVLLTATVVHSTMARDGRSLLCCVLKRKRRWAWETVV